MTPGQLSPRVPMQPAHYLERREDIDDIVQALLAGERTVGISSAGTHQTAHGMHGMGGIGKTVLASAVARSERIRAHFTDGVYWLTLGEDPKRGELARLQADLAHDLGMEAGERGFRDLADGQHKLAAWLAGKRVLLVLDDVWDAEHTAGLRVVDTTGVLLITTRNRQVLTNLGAEEHALDTLSIDNAHALLADWVGQSVAELPDDAARVAARCGRLPLALSIIGAMVREGMEWGDVRQLLEDADIEEIERKFPGYDYPDMLRALDVSVSALGQKLRARYLALAVFPEDEKIPESVLCTLWGVKLAKGRKWLSEFQARSLVWRDDTGHFWLHDLLRMYLVARAADAGRTLAARHSAFVDALAQRCGSDGLARGPAVDHARAGEREYFFARLPYHLVEAGRSDELRGLLMSYRWLDSKLRAAGVVEVMADFERVEGSRPLDRAASLVRDALRLSSHVLARDADQLPGQLLGRLGYFATGASEYQAEPDIGPGIGPDIGPDIEPDIEALLGQVRGQVEHAWLCPTTPALTAPGGPLLRTFEGHSDLVTAVALSQDGRRALSGSEDTTLKFSHTRSLLCRNPWNFTRASARTPANVAQ